MEALAKIAGSKAFAKSKAGRNELCGPSRATYPKNAIKDEDAYLWGYVAEQTTFRKAPSAQSPAVGTAKGEAIRVLECARDRFLQGAPARRPNRLRA